MTGALVLIFRVELGQPNLLSVLDKPQSSEQLGVDRIAFPGSREQPGAGLGARHLVHHDILAFVAATGADPGQPMGADEGDHLGAHAGR